MCKLTNWVMQSQKLTNLNNLQSVQTHKTKQHEAKIDEPIQECMNHKTEQLKAKYQWMQTIWTF